MGWSWQSEQAVGWQNGATLLSLGCLREGLVVTIIYLFFFFLTQKEKLNQDFSVATSFSPTSDTTAARRGGPAIVLPWRALGTLCRRVPSRTSAQWDTLSSLCLAPALLHLKTPLCLWVFLPHSQTTQAKQRFGSSFERAGSPALSGRAGSSSLLSMQMFPGGGGGSDPAMHCLGTSCQCLLRGRESRLPGGVHHVPHLTFGSWVDCKAASEHDEQHRGWGC